MMEERGVGLQWDNTNFSPEGNFNFSWCCYMMLIDAAIYFLLGWYIRGVFPGITNADVLYPTPTGCLFSWLVSTTYQDAMALF